MTFLYPYVLITLLIPLILGWAVYSAHRRRGKNQACLVSPAYRHKLMRTTPVLHSGVPVVLSLVAMACCILAIARPINGYRVGEASITGKSILLAIDISQSMEVTDVTDNGRDTCSRLARAKEEAKNIIAEQKKSKIGLLLFAGTADLTIPLTHHTHTVADTIDEINTKWAYRGGTNFSEVLRNALDTFDRTAGSSANTLIILSDGEDTMNFSPELLQEAKEKHLLIITVGIGSTQGGGVPDSHSHTGYMIDEDGNHVVSALQPKMLRSLAEETGGQYFRIGADDTSASLIKEITDRIENHEESYSYGLAPNDLFMYFAGAALVFLIAAIILATRWRKMPIQSARWLMALACILCFHAPAHATDDSEALHAYKQALQLKSEYEIEACEQELTQALLSENPRIQAAAFHALGNLNAQKGFAAVKALYTIEESEEPSVEDLQAVKGILTSACEHYRDALRIDTNLTQAATNLERVEKYIELLERKIQEQSQQEAEQNEQNHGSTPPPPSTPPNNNHQQDAPPPPPQNEPPPPTPEKANSDFNDYIKNHNLQEDEGEIRYQMQRFDQPQNPTGRRFKNY